MLKALGWARNGLALVGVLALGFWIGAGRTAKASGYDSDAGDVEFQLAGVNQTSSLLVYRSGTKTVYVYQGATTGNSASQCSAHQGRRSDSPCSLRRPKPDSAGTIENSSLEH